MKSRGFTIVELIVTITIMAILLTLGVVNLRSSQANARDAERKTDIESLATNLETFYNSGTNSSTLCPTGFIAVPGSTTYGTSDFCVMKHIAKNDGNGKAVSTAAGLPWGNISQTSAITASASACNGCHLITEAEWMTIAQNVLSVPSNWSGGAVGSGYIYSGHNDGAPNMALAADSNDANGYSGTGNSSPSNQRRTLTLNNGQVVWDMSGNIWQWTTGQTNGTTAQQPGVAGNNYASWIEWPTLTTNGSLPINPLPSGTGLSGASTWNSTKGIGMLISSTTDTGLWGFLRGGTWSGGGNDGILELCLAYGPGSNTHNYIGFRVAFTDPLGKIPVNQKNSRYPSTYVTSSAANTEKLLNEIDTRTITAPGITDSTQTLLAATNNVQTTAGVLPQPTIDQYIYQPLQADGSLCMFESQECRKFNLYYRSEVDNTIYMITSRSQ